MNSDDWMTGQVLTIQNPDTSGIWIPTVRFVLKLAKHLREDFLISLFNNSIPATLNVRVRWGSEYQASE